MREGILGIEIFYINQESCERVDGTVSFITHSYKEPKQKKVFKNEEEFRTCLKLFEQETNSVFYKRSSTNSEDAKKKGVKRHINHNLPYQLRYCLITF